MDSFARPHRCSVLHRLSGASLGRHASSPTDRSTMDWSSSSSLVSFALSFSTLSNLGTRTASSGTLIGRSSSAELALFLPQPPPTMLLGVSLDSSSTTSFAAVTSPGGPSTTVSDYPLHLTRLDMVWKFKMCCPPVWTLEWLSLWLSSSSACSSPRTALSARTPYCPGGATQCRSIRQTALRPLF